MISSVFRFSLITTIYVGMAHMTRIQVVVVVVVDYPTPSEGWGHGGRLWSPRSRATPQGLEQRLYRDRESPKSERRKESIAGQCRMR